MGAGLSRSGRKTVYWPKRTPCLRRLARLSWSSPLTSSATSLRGMTPSASTSRKAMPRAMPVSVSSPLQRDQRLEERGDPAVDPVPRPAADLLGDLGAGVLVDEGLDLRAERVRAGDELADGVLAPHQPALLGDVDLGVGRVVELVRPEAQRRRQRREAGGAQRAGLVGVGGRVEPEAEALEPADELVLDPDLAVLRHCGQQALPLLQPAHQDRGAPVHETLRQLHVQRIRQPVFYRTGLVAPMVRVVHPGPALRDVGPGADVGQPLRQRVDVAIGSIDARDLPRQPVGRDAAAALQEAEDAHAEAGVLGERHLAEVGDLADVPEQPRVRRPAQPVAHLGDAGRAP